VRFLVLLPLAFSLACVHENYQEFVDQNGQIHSCESYANLNRREGVMVDVMIANSQYEKCLRRAHANGWVTPEAHDANIDAQRPAYRDEEEREQLEKEVQDLKRKIRLSREKRAKEELVP
jgi:hypothetical protein